MEGKRVAIIGAGPAGIVTTKLALQYGLQPTTYEKSHTLGGLWRRDGAVWGTMRTNVNRFMFAFSDYPMKAGDVFPTAGEVLEFLEEYAEKFGLRRCIRFGCEVRKVERSGGGWRVEAARSGGPVESAEYDYVVVCSGFFSAPSIPPIPGLSGFTGQVLHASHYKTTDPFAGQRVLVVGGSFSGSEIASQLSKVATTHISLRRTQYLIPRILNTPDFENIPVDFLVYRRLPPSPLSPAESQAMRHNIFESICGDLGQVHPLLKIDKSLPPFPNINDTFLQAVKDNKLHLCPALKEVEGKTAVFEDKSRVEVDVVVFATGYQLEMPFLGEDVLEALKYDKKDVLQPVILYEQAWHPLLKNLAFVGIFDGTFPGSIELQAHWVCSVFAGRVPYPGEEEMRAGLEAEEAVRRVPCEERAPLPNYFEKIESYAKKANLYPSEEFLALLKEQPVVPANYNPSPEGRQISLQAVDFFNACKRKTPQ